MQDARVQPLQTKPQVDWEAIERLYRTGMSLRNIGQIHNVPFSTIKYRARLGNWSKGAVATKRQIIAEAQAGVLPGMKPEVVKKSQEKAIAEDLADMATGLTGYRRLLMVMQQAADLLQPTDPLAEKKGKTMAETIEKSVDGIRKIRGLDDPKKNLSEDELNAIIAEITGAVGEPHPRPEAASS